jgi:hypothetical protein
VWETLALRGINNMRGCGFYPCGLGWGSLVPCCDCGNGLPGSSGESNDGPTPRKELIRCHIYNILHVFDSF